MVRAKIELRSLNFSHKIAKKHKKTPRNFQRLNTFSALCAVILDRRSSILGSPCHNTTFQSASILALHYLYMLKHL